MSLSCSFIKKHRAVWIALALIAAQSGWSSAKGDVPRPTLHELAAIEARGGSRLWYHEEEFQRDPLLRAEPHQVVMLHLEAGDRKGKTIRNTIPYRFTETAEFRFCIPKDEPHIRSIELRRDGGKGNGVEVQVPRGAGCKTRTIPAGLYRLHIEHDGHRIGAAGEKAFVHVPRVRNISLTNTGSGLSACDALSAITAPNGIFVFPLDASAGDLAFRLIAQAGITPGVQVDLATGGFHICKGSDGTYTFASAPQSDGTHYFNSLDGQFGAPYLYALPDKPSQYDVTDLGNFQFTTTWLKDSNDHNPVVMDGNFVRWATAGAPAVFSVPVKFYPPGASVPSLQSGEVALFWDRDFKTTNGTWVVRADLPDATGIVYGFGPGKPNLHLNTISGNFPLSVRVGPDTVASLYIGSNYQNLLANIGGDTACLACAPVGVTPITFGSVRITRARDFIVATNSCRNCNLSGVDLSQLDLSNGFFSGSTFTGANLSNTVFDSAVLDNVNMNGAATDFTGARFLSTRLLCANFTDANLENLDGIEAIISQDFSCRMNLTRAAFNRDTFPLSQWRFFDLTAAKISDLTGAVLSTRDNPLNLAGAILNNTDLSEVVLDGANLGCDTSSGGSICSQLIGANLNRAGLRRADLRSAVLQGANLSFSNLDGANMCAAKLNQSSDQNVSASLQGAFLRNVNLSQADLTGASLENANFYSTAPSSAATCNPASCGFSSSCASAVNARFNNTNFSGAYAAGVDFSGSFPQGADFTGATLSGSNFTNANLTQDLTTGKRTDFSASFLQGTIFTNAAVIGANFTRAVVDLASVSGLTIKEQLDPAAHVAFPGYTPAPGSTPGCVQFTTSRKTVLPQTDSSNICPNSGSGPCTTAQWQAISQPQPPVCTVDLNWIFATY